MHAGVDDIVAGDIFATKSDQWYVLNLFLLSNIVDTHGIYSFPPRTEVAIAAMYSYCLYQENIEQSNTEQSVIGASLFNIVFVLCTMVVSMTGVTRLPCKPDVSPDGRPIRLRQHGLFSFPQNIHNVIFL